MQKNSALNLKEDEMTNTVRKITALFTAFVMAAAILVFIPPVNASAAKLIDYSISYSGKYVKLRLIPQSSSDIIYYTTNNTKPAKTSAVYKKQLAAYAKTTVRAIEYNKSGKSVASIKITITPRAQKPVITETVKNGKLMLTLRSASSGAVIYYTTDGTAPTKNSRMYTGAIEYTRGMTLKARAYVSGLNSSAVCTYSLSDSEWAAATGNDVSGDSIFNDPSASEETKEVVRLLNEERAKRGLAPLVMDPMLDKAASLRAKEVAGHFAHTRPDGSNNFTVLDEMNIDYGYAGENIAGGQTSASAVMSSWMKSTGHRGNILSDNFNKVGIGHYVSGGMDYWVQVFSD